MLAVAGGVVAPAAASTNPDNTSVRSAQTWYSYVQAGEQLSIEFKKISAETKDYNPIIVVLDPSGVEVYRCTAIVQNATIAPIGTTCAKTFPAATTTGVWSVSIVASTSPTIDYTKIGSVQMSWRIDVTSGGVVQDGRTWTDVFRMADSVNTYNPIVNLTLWYQSNTGYGYQATRTGVQGIDANFLSNAFGNVSIAPVVDANGVLVDPGCTAQEMTVLAGINGGSGYKSINWSDCPYTPYKIFFEEPSSLLPAQVKLPDGTTTWLITTPTEPEVTGVTFTATEPGSRTGTVTINTKNFEGTANLLVDTDNDGLFDRTIPFSSVITNLDGSATATVPFDGKDAAGNLIPTYMPLAFKVEIEQKGVIHFIDQDMEIRSGGISVMRLEDPATLSYAPVNPYWNDSWIADNNPTYHPCSIPPVLSSLEALVSGSSHSWAVGSCDKTTGSIGSTATGTWGNTRAIDDWTYLPGSWGASIDYPGYRLTKTATPAPGSAVEVGDTISYQVTATSVPYEYLQLFTFVDDPKAFLEDPSFTELEPFDPQDFKDYVPASLLDSEGLVDPEAWAAWEEDWSMVEAMTWSGRYTDNVADVRDNAAVPLDDLASTPAEGSATVVSGDAWTWTGIDIPLPTPVTTTYEATVTSAADDGELYNIAYVHGSVTPPAPPATCTEDLCGETTHYVAGFELTKTSTVPDGTQVKAGDTITYTVTGKNTGSVPLDQAIVRDDMTGVLDNATLGSFTATVAGTSVTTPTVMDGKWEWSGRLEAGQSAVFTYTVTVNEGQGGQVVKNLASGEATPVVPDPSIPTTPITPGPITITNPIVAPTIQVVKMGVNCDTAEPTCSLAGAEFALYEGDPAAGATAITDGFTANTADEVLPDMTLVAGSKFTSKPLTPGKEYWLVETAAPTGHTLLATPVKFTVDATAGISLLEGAGASVVELQTGDTFTIVVTDPTAGALPKAGGNGPWESVVLALLLMGAAATAYRVTSGHRPAPARVLRD